MHMFSRQRRLHRTWTAFLDVLPGVYHIKMWAALIYFKRWHSLQQFKWYREDKVFPCKIRTGILAGCRRKIARIPARFSPKRNSRRPKSRRDRAWNLVKILAKKQKSRRPKSRRDPAAKLTKILTGKQFPAAKISPESYCESRQDSCREANSQWQKSWRDLAGNLAKISDGKWNSWWDSLPESRHEFLLVRAQCLLAWD